MIRVVPESLKSRLRVPFARLLDVLTRWSGRQVGLVFVHHRHDQLTALSDKDLAGALVEGRAELEELIGQRLSTIAFPHGRADRRLAVEAARKLRERPRKGR